jgi:hypothetical protein
MSAASVTFELHHRLWGIVSDYDSCARGSWGKL